MYDRGQGGLGFGLEGLGFRFSLDGSQKQKGEGLQEALSGSDRGHGCSGTAFRSLSSCTQVPQRQFGRSGLEGAQCCCSTGTVVTWGSGSGISDFGNGAVEAHGSNKSCRQTSATLRVEPHGRLGE